MSRQRIGWLLMDYDNKGKSYIIRKSAEIQDHEDALMLVRTLDPDHEYIIQDVSYGWLKQYDGGGGWELTYNDPHGEAGWFGNYLVRKKI